LLVQASRSVAVHRDRRRLQPYCGPRYPVRCKPGTVRSSPFQRFVTVKPERILTNSITGRGVKRQARQAMLPESPTFYKVTCLISMCCMAMLVVLLVVQPQHSLRFRTPRGQQLRAVEAPRGRNYPDDSQYDRMYSRRTNRDAFAEGYRQERMPDDSNAQLVQAVMRQNALLASSLQSTSIIFYHHVINFYHRISVPNCKPLVIRPDGPTPTQSSGHPVPRSRMLQMRAPDALQHLHHRPRDRMLRLRPWRRDHRHPVPAQCHHPMRRNRARRDCGACH
jgi:hypothetical protein